jgi:hypothetical protein
MKNTYKERVKKSESYGEDGKQRKKRGEKEEGKLTICSTQ